MLIKSMARKSVSFGQLLAYLNAPAETGPALLHNLLASPPDLTAIHGEFLSNSRLLPPRKNGNVLYHEVLAFSEGDREQLNAGILEDLTRRYLEWRAPYALAYARAHFDTASPHVHIMISANALDSSRRQRLSRGEFAALKKRLEDYQRQHYPVLQHSLAQLPHRPDTIRSTWSEQERQRRGVTTPTRKELLRQTILAEISAAFSGPDCSTRLLRRHLKLYRRGRTVGVEDVRTGRRHRLRTLGLEDVFQRSLEQWQRLPARLRSLPRQPAERTRQQRHPRSL